MLVYVYFVLQYAKRISLKPDYLGRKIISCHAFFVFLLAIQFSSSLRYLSDSLLKPWIHINHNWNVMPGALSLLEPLPPMEEKGRAIVITPESDYYVFHELFSKPASLKLYPTFPPLKKDKNRELYRISSAMSEFLLPRDLYLVYARAKDYKLACQKYPKAYIFENQLYGENSSSLRELKVLEEKQKQPPWYIRGIFHVSFYVKTRLLGKDVPPLKEFNLYHCQSFLSL